MNSTDYPSATPAPPQAETPQPPPRFPTAIFWSVALLSLVSGTCVTFSLTPSYTSFARIKVERDQSDISGLQGPQGMLATQYDPYFIQTEYEIIQSELILKQAIDELELPTPAGKRPLKEVWAERFSSSRPLNQSELLSLLRRSLSVRPVRNTSIIEINVESESPGEAPIIANKIAQVYGDYRIKDRDRLIAGGIDALTQRLSEVEGEVRSAQSNVEFLRIELKIPDVGAVESNLVIESANKRPYWEAKRNLDELIRFSQVLRLKIASERTELALPKTSMVQILDSAVPSMRPTRPNKSLNIMVAILFGGLAGLFLATFVFLVQRRAYWQKVMGGSTKRQFSPVVRLIAHISVALVVGLFVGYQTAGGGTISIVVALIIGGILCAWIELAAARFELPPPSSLPGSPEPSSGT
jgi:capsular polysaccharide biosynthesis protein